MEISEPYGEPRSRPCSFAWLRRLRWATLAAQAITLNLTSGWLNLSIRSAPLAAIFLVSAGINVSLAYLPEPLRRSRQTIFLVLACDIVIQTLLLAFSGGPENPFSILYLLPVVLSAVLLDRGAALGLSGISIALFAALFAMAPAPAGHHAGGSGSEGLESHLFGMWIAYSLVAIISAYCITRISEELKRQERGSEAMRLRHHRLASLTTLAAGAAHELATPLGTMAVAVDELDRSLRQSHAVTASTFDDIALIDSQLRRCKDIIRQMSGCSGEVAGEMPSRFPVSQLVTELRQQISARFGERGEQIAVATGDETAEVHLPLQSVIHAVSALTKNALDASRESEAVQVTVRADDTSCTVTVIDRGVGMSSETLSRIGEPFFTTKTAGSGMGLGIFLARLTAENLGGMLKFNSAEGNGTRAELRLPASNHA